jgi:4-alpha-glucanotransferase
MDVLWFARDGDAFLAPAKWRPNAVAMTSTHDLPTVAGWWTGADIAMRDALGLADAAPEMNERARDRAGLSEAFRNANVADADISPEDVTLAVDSAIAFTAQSPAALALIPIEDVLGLAEQPNLPGTIDEHPNWRRRLAELVERVLDARAVRARLKTLSDR